MTDLIAKTKGETKDFMSTIKWFCHAKILSKLISFIDFPQDKQFDYHHTILDYFSILFLQLSHLLFILFIVRTHILVEFAATRQSYSLSYLLRVLEVLILWLWYFENLPQSIFWFFWMSFWRIFQKNPFGWWRWCLRMEEREVIEVFRARWWPNLLLFTRVEIHIKCSFIVIKATPILIKLVLRIKLLLI